jgi:hypothetical protein
VIGPPDTRAESRGSRQTSSARVWREGTATSGDRLTDELACLVMRWKVAPGRFIKAGRIWIPRWRFQPLKCLEDAFQLLKMARAALVLRSAGDGNFSAQVRVGSRTGRASSGSGAASITMAIARAVGLDLPDGAMSSSLAMPTRKESEGRKR